MKHLRVRLRVGYLVSAQDQMKEINNPKEAKNLLGAFIFIIGEAG
jgi:hypothetical protein